MSQKEVMDNAELGRLVRLLAEWASLEWVQATPDGPWHKPCGWVVFMEDSGCKRWEWTHRHALPEDALREWLDRKDSFER